MQNILKPAIIALACLAALGACAQTATITPPVVTGTATVAAPLGQFSLADCIAYATANQPDYQAALLNLQSSGAQLTQSQASYMPTVSVQNNDLHIEDPKNNTGHGTSLQVTHTFYDSGLRDVRNQQAHASLSSDEAGLRRTKQTLDFNVTSAYVSLLRAQKLLTVSNEQLKYVQDQYDVLKKRVDVGDAARVDLLPLAAQLASSRVSKINAENNIRKARVALKNIIGLSLAAPFEITEIKEPAAFEIKNVDDYLQTAKNQRPELLQAQLNQTTAELNLKSAKINRGPRFQVNGNYGMDIDSKMARNWSVTGVISYNIFDGNLLKAKEDEAGSNLDATLQRAASTFNGVQSDVWNAYLNLQNAKERRTATDASLLAARANSDAQLARAKAGLGTSLDIT
ncbi:MAG: TolC family protein, partial [bacterium]